MIQTADQPDERRLTMDLQTHPAAELFPAMTGLELEELKEDIREHGQREPITLLDGYILDGRNRYRACRELGILPRFDNFPGGDPVDYVVSKNLHRRHLNESQRASVAAKLGNLTHGQRADYARQAETQVCVSAPVTRAEAAELLNVSERSVCSAKAVHKQGVPELVQALDQGKVSVATAATIAKLTPEEQRVRLNARPEQKKKRKHRPQEFHMLDDETKTILYNHKITCIQKEMRELYRIGGGCLTEKQRLTVWHSIATMIMNGKAKSVEGAKIVILREWADSKLRDVGSAPGSTDDSN
jgi:ParB-like chromosome segregation protein Spo0J